MGRTQVFRLVHDPLIVFQIGGLAEYVGLAVTFTLIASSSGSSREKSVIMQSAHRPWLPLVAMQGEPRARSASGAFH